ncbi:MAG: hypothetical protein A2020_12910 [Lentisphaerae bacterium GWF2_45_14]|nr:MAG: hypothetical protein A2020_12910 [Lentisphaerae bacterium GWF2_45_14]
MGKIKVLPEHVSNKIAAGEVIERPASVVKELTENSLDSGALSISVNVEKSGSKLISVSDNGSGMDQDDALQCLEPHATSKIFSEKDILEISSFGFRGEAIPSIASVSRFTLRTRMKGSMEGTEVNAIGGKVLSAAPAGCAPGTEILIKDIFFNTPARKKFLRSGPTEDSHIQQALMMLALPNPHVSFELVMDGKKIFSSPAADTILPRVRTFFGQEMEKGLMPLKYSASDIKVSGYIARHGFSRTSRREQRVFINGRPVEALPVYQGIREGYGSLVEKGRFPPVILFLRLDPQLVDVNVHPAKREVRFRNPQLISSVVSEAIRSTLRLAAGPSTSVNSSISLRAMLEGAGISYQPSPREEQYLGLKDLTDEKENMPPCEEKTFSDQEYSQPLHFQGVPELPGSGPLKILGFLGDTYVIAAGATGLMIIDQHAAHERVLYERILKNAGGQLSQRLLIPVTLEVSKTAMHIAEKLGNLLCETGFEIEPFGQNSIIVNAIPSDVKQENVSSLITSLLDNLVEDESTGKNSTDLEKIAMAACKSAVKANDKLSMEEALSLLHQMAHCEMPFSCPHGRPTVINISIGELEKRFGRK